MSGWKGLGQMRHQHPARIRRVDLGDLVRYCGPALPRRAEAISTIWGLWLDCGRMWVLVRLPSGMAWVPSDDCEVMETP